MFSEEERCRVREKELREKDILIQDNLIRFSSFLQQQDQRKKKDEEAAQQEIAKIKDKEKEIKQQDIRQSSLQEHSKLIDRKLEQLRKYDDFLKKVQDQHKDEFVEPQDIIGRY